MLNSIIGSCDRIVWSDPSDKIYRVDYDIIARVLIVCSLFNIYLYIYLTSSERYLIFSIIFQEHKIWETIESFMLNFMFFPLILGLKEVNLCSIFYSNSQLLSIDALPHNITKELNDGLCPKKEVTIQKTLIYYSYLLETLRHATWVLPINWESQM